MSYKRISIRFNLNIEDERNAWELLHSNSCGPINKEVIDSINTAHKLLNCTPFVRQYDILSNKWGVLLCQKEYRTNDTRQNSRNWSWRLCSRRN